MKSTFVARLIETASVNASKVAFVDQDGTRRTTARKVAEYIRRQGVPAHSFPKWRIDSVKIPISGFPVVIS